MKLLLTSNGFSNDAIAQALRDLLGRPLTETSLVFVPTASNVEKGDKSWFIDDLANIKKQGFTSVMIADISAVSETIWRPQFEQADVLFFEGGNSYHLMSWMRKSGLEQLLPAFLLHKVYVGLSAGSMVTAPNLDLRLSNIIYGEEAEKERMQGLGYVDFNFLPHLNNPHFGTRISATLDKAMKGVTRKTYVLDDNSALKVVNGHVEHVGGAYLEFN